MVTSIVKVALGLVLAFAARRFTWSFIGARTIESLDSCRLVVSALRALTFLVVLAFLLTACGGGEGVEDRLLRLTFDGESCTYEGPTELTGGPVELIFLNKSEASAAVNFLMLLEGKTIQDAIEYGEPYPTSKHAPSWTRELGTWRSVAAGESHHWEGDLKPASYFMVCARTSPLGVWFGTGLTVEG